MVGPTSERLLSSAAMIIDQCRSIGGDWLGQCHPAERFTGRLAYQARRNRIGLGCKPLRRHRHFRGGPAAGGPAYSPIAIQFGEEPLFECLGRPVVFRIFEGDRAGLRITERNSAGLRQRRSLKPISPICRWGNAASRMDITGARGSPCLALK